MRPGGWRPTTAYGLGSLREATCRRCGRTLRPSSATSRRDPIRPRPASPIAPPGSLAGSPASIARRGITSNARSALFQPGRDDDLAFRFGADPGVTAMAYLAIASWPLGEVDRAISLIDRMQTRMADLTHVGTLANGRMHAAIFELMRGDQRARRAERIRTRPARARARPANVSRVRRVSRGLGDRCDAVRSASGLEDMRRGVELLREQNVLFFDGLLKIALAEAEARAGDPDRAIAILDEALATVDRMGYRAFEAELHRVARRNPAQARPRQPRARRRRLPDRHRRREAAEAHAASNCARRCRWPSSTNRPVALVDAHAVLAPALEGFAPTPEMPEIAEAQALLAALAETDEVKDATASQRQRRLKLQTSYGQAMMLSRGFASEETIVAFTRAQELSSRSATPTSDLTLTTGYTSVSYCAAKSDPRARPRKRSGAKPKARVV